jgi:hypothetical protein
LRHIQSKNAPGLLVSRSKSAADDAAVRINCKAVSYMRMHYVACNIKANQTMLLPPNRRSTNAPGLPVEVCR